MILSIFYVASGRAQTVPVKDAMNNFARYSDSRNIKDLENARKSADDAYKTRSDSAGFRNNLIRALVYSTLARVDSNLRFTYKKDPVDEALHSLDLIEDTRSARDSKHELLYITDQLHKTYLYRASSSFRQRKFPEAIRYYQILDAAGYKDPAIVHNLALLYQETSDYTKAAECYKRLTELNPKPEYFLVLANLYESLGQERSSVEILKQGTELYQSNRDLVFKLINILVNRNDFVEITKYSEKALKLDEYNINLNYLAAFSYETAGDPVNAEKYYKEVLNINPNNYEGNYSLGLFYMNRYLQDKTKGNLLDLAKYYLTKANEIDPNELKSLTSLSLLYKYSGNRDELSRINERINQLKLN